MLSQFRLVFGPCQREVLEHCMCEALDRTGFICINLDFGPFKRWHWSWQKHQWRNSPVVLTPFAIILIACGLFSFGFDFLRPIESQVRSDGRPNLCEEHKRILRTSRLLGNIVRQTHDVSAWSNATYLTSLFVLSLSTETNDIKNNWKPFGGSQLCVSDTDMKAHYSRNLFSITIERENWKLRQLIYVFILSTQLKSVSSTSAISVEVFLATKHPTLRYGMGEVGRNQLADCSTYNLLIMFRSRQQNSCSSTLLRK